VALFGLGVFGPGIAAGLISGAPQLGAGAAVGSVGGLAAGAVAGGVVAAAGTRAAASGIAGAVKSGASVAGGANTAYTLSRAASGAGGAAGVAAGVSGIAKAAGDSALHTLSAPARAVGQAYSAGGRRAFQATGGTIIGASPAAASPMPRGAPPWARRLRAEQNLREAGMATAHAVRDGDRPGSADAPRLKEDE